MRGRAGLRRWKRKRSNDKKEEKEIHAAGGFAPRPAGWGLGGAGGCVSSERAPPPAATASLGLLVSADLQRAVRGAKGAAGGRKGFLQSFRGRAQCLCGV